jgi:hypothetical protein
LGETRFRIDAENVVHETVDGEVIAIDLARGSYYSLSGSGPAIWEQLAVGSGAAEISTVLSARYDGDAEEIRVEVAGLLEQLLESSLIVAADGSGESSAPIAADNDKKDPFEAPKLERYTDMKDYFLLDPIHEVDPAGWPRPAA